MNNTPITKTEAALILKMVNATRLTQIRGKLLVDQSLVKSPFNNLILKSIHEMLLSYARRANLLTIEFLTFNDLRDQINEKKLDGIISENAHDFSKGVCKDILKKHFLKRNENETYMLSEAKFPLYELRNFFLNNLEERWATHVTENKEILSKCVTVEVFLQYFTEEDDLVGSSSVDKPIESIDRIVAPVADTQPVENLSTRIVCVECTPSEFDIILDDGHRSSTKTRYAANIFKHLIEPSKTPFGYSAMFTAKDFSLDVDNEQLKKLAAQFVNHRGSCFRGMLKHFYFECCMDVIRVHPKEKEMLSINFVDFDSLKVVSGTVQGYHTLEVITTDSFGISRTTRFINGISDIKTIAVRKLEVMKPYTFKPDFSTRETVTKIDSPIIKEFKQPTAIDVEPAYDTVNKPIPTDAFDVSLTFIDPAISNKSIEQLEDEIKESLLGVTANGEVFRAHSITPKTSEQPKIEPLKPLPKIELSAPYGVNGHGKTQEQIKAEVIKQKADFMNVSDPRFKFNMLQAFYASFICKVTGKAGDLVELKMENQGIGSLLIELLDPVKPMFISVNDLVFLLKVNDNCLVYTMSRMMELGFIEMEYGTDMGRIPHLRRTNFTLNRHYFIRMEEILNGN